MLGMPGEGDVKNEYRTDGKPNDSITGRKASVMRCEVFGFIIRMRTGVEDWGVVMAGWARAGNAVTGVQRYLSRS